MNNSNTEITWTEVDQMNAAHYNHKWQRRKAIHLENGDAVVYVFYSGRFVDVVIERQNGTHLYNRVSPASLTRLTNVCQVRGLNIDMTPAWFVPTGVR